MRADQLADASVSLTLADPWRCPHIRRRLEFEDVKRAFGERRSLRRWNRSCNKPKNPRWGLDDWRLLRCDDQTIPRAIDVTARMSDRVAVATSGVDRQAADLCRISDFHGGLLPQRGT
jgi:hypothetical protein